MTRLSLLLPVLALAACASYDVTPSGPGLGGLLAERHAAVAVGTAEPAASRPEQPVEPLALPARIGLVRLQWGRVVAVPPGEAAAWTAFAETIGHLGSFTVVDPVEGRLASIGVRSAGRFHGYETAETLRRVAEGRRLDALLVYEVDAQAQKYATPLAFADLTILGAAILPSRRIDAVATASAALIDPRTGFVYGTARADATDERFSPAFGSDRARAETQETVRLGALEALLPRVRAMAEAIVRETATRR